MSSFSTVPVHQFQKEGFDISAISSRTTDIPIKNFKILGERCTGTHFVQYAMKHNFDITFQPGDSHFFGTTPLNISDDTLLICVVRHSVDWIDSFMKRLHHIPPMNKISIKAFITNEFYSIFEEGPNIYGEIMEDRNYITKDRYKNIFDLRYHKQKYFLEEVPKFAKNYLILPYEYLRDHYEDALTNIGFIFELKPRKDNFSPIIKYKGSYNNEFKIKDIIVSQKYADIILSSVCPEQETRIGYHTSMSCSNSIQEN
jgi:hypothetical protein